MFSLQCDNEWARRLIYHKKSIVFVSFLYIKAKNIICLFNKPLTVTNLTKTCAYVGLYRISTKSVV